MLRRHFGSYVLAAGLLWLLSPASAAAGEPFVTSIRRISTSESAVQSNGASFDPAISRDGTRVVFASRASGLVPDDTNGFSDIFLKDLRTNEIRMLSRGPGGRAANGDSYDPVFSPDGTAVAFVSRATNLARTAPIQRPQVYVKPLAPSGGVFLATRDRSGALFPRMADRPVYQTAGALVFRGFLSDDPRSGGIYRRDSSGRIALVSSRSDGTPLGGYEPVATSDSVSVAYLSTTDHRRRADGRDWLHSKNVVYGHVSGVPIGPRVPAGGGSVTYTKASGHGSYVAVGAEVTAPNATAPYRKHVVVTGIGPIRPQRYDLRTDPFLSVDGRWLITAGFSDPAETSTNGIFVRSRETGAETRIVRGNQPSEDPSTSANSRRLVFTSAASDLVPGDTNNVADIFVATVDER